MEQTQHLGQFVIDQALHAGQEDMAKQRNWKSQQCHMDPIDNPATTEANNVTCNNYAN
jgi:hypothetical protein